MESWDYKELFKALDHCTDKLLHTVILMCVACRMRIGELLALHWSDIVQEPKVSKELTYTDRKMQVENIIDFALPASRRG